MSLLLDLGFLEKTQLCWERGNWDGPSGGDGKCGGLPLGSPWAAAHSGAGQQGGAVASGTLWTVDKAVSTAVPSWVGSLCCEAPVTWCPPASGSENGPGWAPPPDPCSEQLPADHAQPPGHPPPPPPSLFTARAKLEQCTAPQKGMGFGIMDHLSLRCLLRLSFK